jgi:hypothetical protein
MVSQLHRFIERTQAIGREHAFIDLVLTNGFRPLACRRERCDQSVLRFAVTRIACRPTLGHFDRAGWITRCLLRVA